MPPRSRLTREMIIDAAFEIARVEGAENINVRNVAAKLGCSTQPVMYNFKTMDELRLEAYALADRFHSEYIMSKGENACSPLLELGLNYVRFANEEKALFRFLFQSGHFSGQNMDALTSDPALSDIFTLVSAQSGCSPNKAKNAFKMLFISAHGLAALYANNAMEYDEAGCAEILTTVYNGLFNKEN